MIEYKHGDIVLVHFENQADPDSLATHPALVVSSDTVNDNLQTVIVCPIIDAQNVSESRVGATFIPKEIADFGENQLALSFHIKTISRERISKRLAALPSEYMQQIRESLQAVLNLD